MDFNKALLIAIGTLATVVVPVLWRFATAALRAQISLQKQIIEEKSVENSILKAKLEKHENEFRKDAQRLMNANVSAISGLLPILNRILDEEEKK